MEQITGCIPVPGNFFCAQTNTGSRMNEEHRGIEQWAQSKGYCVKAQQ